MQNISKKTKIIGTIIAIVIIIAAIVAWRYYTSPQYSLFKAWQACQNHDRDSFDKYVDVNKLSSNVVDGVTDSIVPSNQDGGVLSTLTRGFIGFVKPIAVNEIKQGIYRYVDSGNWSPEDANKTSSSNDKTPASELSNKLPIDKLLAGNNSNNSPLIEYRSYSSEKLGNNLATVKVELYYQPLQKNISIVFRMYDEGTYYRLIGIDNIPQLLKALQS